MAAGLGFKTFTTGEVLTAADTNGYLMQGILVFASAAARDAAITSPQEGQFAYLKDTNATTYYTGSAWAASGGGGGKVLQVVNATTSTSTTIASTTYTDTTLTATITPTSATSKILVLVTQVAKMSRAASGFQTLDMQLLRGASVVYLPDQETMYFEAGSVTLIDIRTLINMHYYDSPATTSATTYKTQGRIGATSDSGSSTYQSSSRVSSMTLLEIGA